MQKVLAYINNKPSSKSLALKCFVGLFVIACVLFVLYKQAIVFYLPILAMPVFFLINRLLLLSYLLFAALSFSKDFPFGGSLTLDLPDEFLMLLSTASLIVYLIVSKAKKLKLLLNDALFTCLMLIFLYLLLSIFWSEAPILSAKYFVAKIWYFLPFALGVFVLQQFSKNYVFNVLAILTYTTTIAVCITIGYHVFIGLNFKNVNIASGLLFLNHVNYGSLVAIIIPVAYYHYRYNNYFSKFKKINLSCLIILCLGLVQSYCRSAWLAVIIAAIVVWLFYNKLLFKSYLITLGLVVVFMVWLLSGSNYMRFKNNFSKTEFHSDFSDHWQSTFNGRDVSNAERFYRWAAGMRMGKAYLPLGSGSNTFYPIYKKYAVNAFKTWVSRNDEHSTVHNFFLLLFIEQGIIGLFLFLLLIGVLFYQLQTKGLNIAHKKLTALIVAIFVIVLMQLTSSDVLESDKVGTFFYFGFGLWWLIKNNLIPASKD